MHRISPVMLGGRGGHMSSSTIYYINPPPDGDYLLELAQKISKDGYSLSFGEKEILLMTETKQILLDKGPTAILSQEVLTEEVLPDNTPRNAVLDTLKYKLNRCSASQSLHIIDPYLYPSTQDSDYVSDFINIFEATLKLCSYVSIATKANRNASLEQQIENEIKKVNPQVSILKKYTNVFHDRFWIVDDVRGVFVGTSLNGIGKRYAIIDYLQENDAQEIVQRYNQIP